MKILKIYSKRDSTVFEYEAVKNDIDEIRDVMSLTEGQCRTVLSMMENSKCRYVKITGGENSNSLIFESGTDIHKYCGGLPLSDGNAIPETGEPEDEAAVVEDDTTVSNSDVKKVASTNDAAERPRKSKKA